MIRAGTKRRLSPVPDANEEMDTSQLFCHSPMLWCCCGARRNRGSMDTRPVRSMLQNMCSCTWQPLNPVKLMDGPLTLDCISPLPSIVKVQCSLQHYYYSHIHHLGCRFYQGMNIIMNVNIRLCGTVLRVIWSTKFQFKGSIINHLKEA